MAALLLPVDLLAGLGPTLVGAVAVAAFAASLKGVAVLPTPDRVWHRDSRYWRKFIREGTQQ